TYAVDRALAYDPAHRFTSMREFAVALGLTARAAGIALPEDPDPIGLPDFARNDTRETVTQAPPGAGRQPRRARGRGLALGVLLVLAVLAFVLGGDLRRESAPSARAAASPRAAVSARERVAAPVSSEQPGPAPAVVPTSEAAPVQPAGLPVE